MAWTGDPIWLADVLRAAGLKVIEQPGWRNRGHGDFKSITHVMWHHTAGGGDQDWYWVQNGTNGLAGPLSQLVLERDGTYRIIAAGVAWHAGVGSWPGLPTNNANWHAIGIEAVNNGRGQEWPQVQREAYRIGTAAILRKLGRGADGVVAHKEYAKIQGKIDPYGFDMADERRRVAALLAGKPPTSVRNEIDHFAAQAANAWIGKRTKPGEVAMAKGGRAAEFEHAIVYWSAASGTHAVPRGPLLEDYQRRGGTAGPLGYPVRAHAELPQTKDRSKGLVQAFEGGIDYLRGGVGPGAVVMGVIGARWASEGYEKGPAGYPLSDEAKTADGGRVQAFEHDVLAWHPSGAVKVGEA